ncbi:MULTISPECIES: hypothetical protein [Burkholderia]|uniref:hypothetical protein n=1 Tax=Burkholderia TaxID=32008 RepID=UPI000863A186|nr:MULTISPECIES: hypothetical protein [Burkholderia]AOL07216.1 hypothetical protein WI95_25255 [Burkholderia contaminans]MCA7887222.1 hypothetical protein [Burkholderia contaminans]
MNIKAGPALWRECRQFVARFPRIFREFDENKQAGEPCARHVPEQTAEAIGGAFSDAPPIVRGG